jgi:hypothetical protein
MMRFLIQNVSCILRMHYIFQITRKLAQAKIKNFNLTKEEAFIAVFGNAGYKTNARERRDLHFAYSCLGMWCQRLSPKS